MKNEYITRGFYEVEKIVAHKKKKNKKYYLIKWLSYPISECTWEPLINLQNVHELVDEFEKGYPNTFDREIYEIFCESKKKITKPSEKKKTFIKKKLSKPQKEEPEKASNILKENNIEYFDKLSSHLYIGNNKNKDGKIINLNEEEKKTAKSSEEKSELKTKISVSKLIKPIIIQ